VNACGTASGRQDFATEAFCVTGARTHALRAEGADASEDGTGRGTPIVACRSVAQALTSNYGKQVDNSDTALGPNVVAFHHNAQAAQLPTAGGRDTGISDSLTSAASVRRLTPIECERLQGFPDGYTAIPWRGKPAEDCPDGPRYKALGNSWAVPCARWIGRRIHQALALDPTA
jgi:DNA (cytosine-5)-methyltransferase 1